MTLSAVSKRQGPLKPVNDFFSSIKLTIFVLISLAVTSIFGTVIQQEKDPSVYAQEYGAAIGKLIQILNLGDMYHSWWFVLLLTLLMLNITFCSWKRLPQAIRVMRDKEPVFDGRPVAIHEKWEVRLKGRPVDQAAALVEQALGEGFRRPLRKEVEGKVYFFASRGAWSRMGVYVTHFSLFLFAAGALIGARWGYKGFVQIVEGESVSEVRLRSGELLNLGFTVRCDDFQLEFYNDPAGRPTGRPKDYRSTLVVIENGQEVVHKTIEVNDPLIHHGIYFYQSSYGQAGGRGAWLSVFGPRRNLLAHRIHLDRGGAIPLEGGDRLILRNLAGDFRGMGPAAEVALERDGKQGEPVVVFEAAQGNQRRLGDYVVRLEGVDTVMYTGLQVAKDPGVPVVWAGCILITLGCLVAFFTSHRRVWARVQPDDKGTHVFIGGNASRNRISFEKHFADLCQIAQESFEK